MVLNLIYKAVLSPRPLGAGELVGWMRHLPAPLHLSPFQPAAPLGNVTKHQTASAVLSAVRGQDRDPGGVLAPSSEAAAGGVGPGQPPRLAPLAASRSSPRCVWHGHLSHRVCLIDSTKEPLSAALLCFQGSPA